MLAAIRPAGEELSARLNQARCQTDELFAIVREDALYDRPIPERHRIVFYIGHLEAFDWNLLRDRVIDLDSFDPDLDRLFAFGIDPVDGGLPADTASDWPALQGVRQYVERIRHDLDSALSRVLDKSTDPTSRQLLNVAVEHRLMHAETLAYMLHQLSPDRKISPPRRPEPVSAPVPEASIQIPRGTVVLGLRRSDTQVFGWDNEYEAHEVDVPAFSIEKYKVTNRQYLAFMEAGGYNEPLLWKAADWQWRRQNDISHPVFWSKSNQGWVYRTMFGELPLPLDWPVYVSHAEACAYARWSGKSLPTEAQWQRAAFGGTDGKIEPQAKQSISGNFDFQTWNPVPVGSPRQSDSPFGVSGMWGNGWEWTSTVFGPFNGFEPYSFYPGYSANFFDGQHFVMKGGSARTARCMMRPSFRNWFQAHYQYVYSGFRCVSN